MNINLNSLFCFILVRLFIMNILKVQKPMRQPIQVSKARICYVNYSFVYFHSLGFAFVFKGEGGGGLGYFEWADD